MHKTAAVPTPTKNFKASLMYNNSKNNGDDDNTLTESKAKRQRM